MDAFLTAALRNDTTTVTAMLAQDPGLINAANAVGNTALHLCCSYDRQAMVQQLLLDKRDRTACEE
jgi:ankyrin repeat protein